MPPSVSVVLSRPQYPRNVGQVARAMANLGFGKLEIVQPPHWTEESFFEARQGAARAQAPLQNRKEYPDWSHFYAAQPSTAVRIGFSRRGGRRRPVTPWETYLKEELPSLQDRPHLLIFGTEDAGLSAEDLDLVHHVCELPAAIEQPSYNLSQAVLLALFMWNQSQPQSKLTTQAEVLEEPAQLFPEAALYEWLHTLGFQLENRGVSAFTVMKRLLLSRTPTPQELSVLEAVIHQTVRKLKNSNK